MYMCRYIYIQYARHNLITETSQIRLVYDSDKQISVSFEVELNVILLTAFLFGFVTNQYSMELVSRDEEN